MKVSLQAYLESELDVVNAAAALREAGLRSEIDKLSGMHQGVSVELSSSKELLSHAHAEQEALRTTLEKAAHDLALLMGVQERLERLEQENVDLQKVSRVVALQNENAKLKAELNDLKTSRPSSSLRSIKTAAITPQITKSEKN